MNGETLDNFLLLGKVVRPHGLEGLLRIWSYAQSKKSFLNRGIVFLKPDSGEVREFEILSLKPHKNIYLLKLKGMDSVEEAEKYRGASILVSKGSLIREDDEEFFWYELIGLSVYLDTGEMIGKIKSILPTGSHDIYVVHKGKKEFYIPAIHEVVKEIDLKNKKMTVTAMEGMLELNEV